MSEENSVPQFPSEQELTKFFGVEPKRTLSCIAYYGIGVRDGIDFGSCRFSLDYSSRLCSISHSDASSYMPDGESEIASRVWIDWDANAVFIEWAEREPGSRPASITLLPFPRIYRGSPIRTPVQKPEQRSGCLAVATALVGLLFALVILGTFQGSLSFFTR